MGEARLATMTPLTLDLPPEMRARLAEEAERRNVTESAFVHAAVAKALAEAEKPGVDQAQPVAEPREASVDQPESSGRVSCLDLAGDLIGCVRSGTPDLATNPHYLEEAIVRDGKTRARGGIRP